MNIEELSTFAMIFIMVLVLIALVALVVFWWGPELFPQRKNKKEEKTTASQAEEKSRELPEEVMTAAALAKRNWEKILAYCEEHHYHLLSDRKYSLNMPSYIQGNLYALLQEKEKEEIKEEYYIMGYFVIHEHKIMTEVEYKTKSYRECRLLVDMTEESELTVLLCSCVIDCWDNIRSWLKEPEKLLQKCLTFSPEA